MLLSDPCFLRWILKGEDFLDKNYNELHDNTVYNDEGGW